MRSIAGRMMPVTSQSTPPGDALNWPAFFTLVLLFAASIAERISSKER
jgi:membrane protease YdiL (CAAX protease family)